MTGPFLNGAGEKLCYGRSHRVKDYKDEIVFSTCGRDHPTGLLVVTKFMWYTKELERDQCVLFQHACGTRLGK